MLGIILTPYGKIPGAYPSEIAYSYGGDGTFMCPDDPYYNQRGEVGLYYDTQLGGLGTITENMLAPLTLLNTAPAPRRQPIRSGGGPLKGIFGKLFGKRRGLNGLGHSVPSDFELAPSYGYTPMIDGWVSAREGFNPGSWIPPNGWNPAGAYGPPMAPATYSYPGALGDATLPDPVQTAANAAAQSINDTLQAHQDRMFKLTIISTTIVGLSALLATMRTWRQLKRDEELFRSRG